MLLQKVSITILMLQKFLIKNIAKILHFEKCEETSNKIFREKSSSSFPEKPQSITFFRSTWSKFNKSK